MAVEHVETADDLYLFEKRMESKVSSTYTCLHDLLCTYGAGIRVSETRRKLILEFRAHMIRTLLIMHAGSSAPDVGGFKSYMSDNSDSDYPAKFEAFIRLRSEISYSPVLQQLCRKGSAECHYLQNLNSISNSHSNSYTSPELPRKKSDRKDRGLAYRAKLYVSPSSNDVIEVEYATQWYSESLGRPSLSPATTKRFRYQVEADMAEMSSVSKS